MDVVGLRFGCTARPFYHGLAAAAPPTLKRHDAIHFQIPGHYNTLTVKDGGKRIAINCEIAQEENEERRENLKIVVGGKKGCVRLRLARRGHKHRPFYRVVAADSRAKRDGKFLEILGYYDPLTGKDGGKRMGINFERTKYWLSVGAQPSDTLQRLFFRAGMLSSPPNLAFQMPTGPRDQRIICEIKGVTSNAEQP